MNTLYELTEDYKMFAELLYDEEADTESIEQACALLADDIKLKADSYARIIKDLSGSAEVIEKEEKRLANKRRALENRVGWLKHNLQNAMEALGEKKIKTDFFSFNIQRNPQTASIGDEEAFISWALETGHSDFVKFGKPSVNKTKVKEYLQAGNTLEKAELKQTESLRIR